MEPRCRPLSQQLAPEDLTVVPETSIPRETLTRKSTRHEPLPEKYLPEYPSLAKQPHQQYAPDTPLLPGRPTARDHLDNGGPSSMTAAPHEQIAPRENLPLSRQQRPDNNGDDMEPILNSYTPIGDGRRSPTPEKNGELPYDQLIPLEELPNETPQRYSQAPTVVDEQPMLRRPRRRRPNTGSNDSYNATAAHCLGIILIVIGILEIALNIAGIFLQHFFRTNSAWNIVFFLAPGLWCSIFFILCGALGVVSARRRVTWSIVTHLVAATLASVFACLLLAMSAWGIHREIVIGVSDGASLACLILVCAMAFGALLALPIALVGIVICCQVFCKKAAG